MALAGWEAGSFLKAQRAAQHNVMNHTSRATVRHNHMYNKERCRKTGRLDEAGLYLAMSYYPYS
ncbi:hypothetical protein E2C01_072435 [Portunus trituberculatus]|uniref:Uncharacterized protein n=1 Tax=Portunus trituberculatus TaxID=210409 RepID=A0A5B7IB67_PORTR|nr:hypothetical protein [Portunus trituberculatus]